MKNKKWDWLDEYGIENKAQLIEEFRDYIDQMCEIVNSIQDDDYENVKNIFENEIRYGVVDALNNDLREYGPEEVKQYINSYFDNDIKEQKYYLFVWNNSNKETYPLISIGLNKSDFIQEQKEDACELMGEFTKEEIANMILSKKYDFSDTNIPKEIFNEILSERSNELFKKYINFEKVDLETKQVLISVCNIPVAKEFIDNNFGLDNANSVDNSKITIWCDFQETFLCNYLDDLGEIMINSFVNKEEYGQR